MSSSAAMTVLLGLPSPGKTLNLEIILVFLLPKLSRELYIRI